MIIRMIWMIRENDNKRMIRMIRENDKEVPTHPAAAQSQWSVDQVFDCKHQPWATLSSFKKQNVQWWWWWGQCKILPHLDFWPPCAIMVLLQHFSVAGNLSSGRLGSHHEAVAFSFPLDSTAPSPSSNFPPSLPFFPPSSNFSPSSTFFSQSPFFLPASNCCSLANQLKPHQCGRNLTGACSKVVGAFFIQCPP